MEKLSCAQAKQINMVDYLATLGYQPVKIRNNDYWYLSPFRTEKSASFKVNQRLNVWFDFGDGKGGDLIDFGTRYFKCSVNELLEKLSAGTPIISYSFHPPSTAGEKKKAEGKIVILEARQLASKPLLDYLQKRSIPLDIAERFCKEVDFLLHEKKYNAIGFENNTGGYELRNEYFKGSSSPKDVTFFNNNEQKLAVFEGFFNYLSFLTINKDASESLPNFLVLNSLSFFEKAKGQMLSHEQIHLYLDRDAGGYKCTQQALQWDKARFTDRSQFYQYAKDLNEWLIDQSPRIKKNRRLGRRF